MSSACRRLKLCGLVLTISAVALFSAGPANADQIDWVCVGGPTPNPVCVEV